MLSRHQELGYDSSWNLLGLRQSHLLQLVRRGLACCSRLWSRLHRSTHRLEAADGDTGEARPCNCYEHGSLVRRPFLPRAPFSTSQFPTNTTLKCRHHVHHEVGDFASYHRGGFFKKNQNTVQAIMAAVNLESTVLT